MTSSTRIPMPARKRIALIAHDRRVADHDAERMALLAEQLKR